MSDYPIIFSAPMVRALLDGRKTMTRRLAWKEPRDPSTHRIADSYERPSPWQKVKPGDRLYVRENWKACQTCGGTTKMVADPVDDPLYCAECRLSLETRIRPSIHMPRWASRITLVVTATKVELLQDISEEDAKAEGTELSEATQRGQVWHASHRSSFTALWMSLHGIDAWDANPEVVALTFTVHKTNIDHMQQAA